MKLYKSPIYDQFRCIASACPDSCCHEWTVVVDPATAEYYRTLQGDLGLRLRQILAVEDGDTVFTNEDNRCPMWRTDGLCQIQAELGHDALCKTCRDFPRLTHDYGNFQELQLELSCPEAARLILTSPPLPQTVAEMPGGDTPDYDADAMQILLHTRDEALAILAADFPVGDTLALLLLYGYQAQAALDGGEMPDFRPAEAILTARSFAKSTDPARLLDFCQGLEILTDRWQKRLNNPGFGRWEPAHLAIARYFVSRYWLQAVSDYDLVSRVKLTVSSCLIIKLLGGDLIETAQLYAKEIENNADNIDALLDAAYTAPAFTDEKLLGLLLDIHA